MRLIKERIFFGITFGRLVGSIFILQMLAPAPMHAASEFGFNYWPYRESSWVLFDRDWSDEKQEIAADLDHQASLGAGVVRVMIWGFGHSGWLANEPGKGTRFTSDYDELKRNLPELLALIAERRMRAVICFGNSFIDRFDDRLTRRNPWETLYGRDGWDRFLADSTHWMQGIMEACERSPYAGSVIYYDLQNEPSQHYSKDRMWDYIRHIYDAVPWPKGKIGISPMFNNAGQPGDHSKVSDVDLLKSALGERKFDYVEYHWYPRDTVQHSSNPRYADATAKIRAVYPEAKVVIGEFGMSASGPEREGIQARAVQELSDYALRTPEVAYHLHWLFWDKLMGIDSQTWGLGYDPDTPKDALGVVAALHQRVPNPDMEETKADASLASWEAGGDANPILSRSFAGVAAGSTAARLELASDKSGLARLISASFAIPAGASRRLYANAYVRGTFRNVRLQIEEYDSAGNLVQRADWPGFDPEAGIWRNYLHRVGSQSQPLSDTTTAVRVAVQGEGGASGYMMVDLVTADVR